MSFKKSFFKIAEKDGLDNFDFVYKNIQYSMKKPQATQPGSRLRLFSFKTTAIISFILIFIISYYLFKPTDKLPLISNKELINTLLNKNENELASILRKFKYVDFQDQYGWTPLHWAYYSQDDRKIQFLLKIGASPDIQSTRDWFVFPKGLKPADIATTIKNLLR